MVRQDQNGLSAQLRLLLQVAHEGYQVLSLRAVRAHPVQLEHPLPDVAVKPHHPVDLGLGPFTEAAVELYRQAVLRLQRILEAQLHSCALQISVLLGCANSSALPH